MKSMIIARYRFNYHVYVYYTHVHVPRMLKSYTGCDQIIQVSRKDVEQYTLTGVNKPPCCEMTVKAADGSTPPDLTLPVIFTGVKQPTTITLEREAQQCITEESSLSSEQETGNCNLCNFRQKKQLLFDLHMIVPNTCAKCSITSWKGSTIGQ